MNASGDDSISIALVNAQSCVREQRKQDRRISLEATPVSNLRQPQPSSRFPARRVDTASTDLWTSPRETDTGVLWPWSMLAG
jgi:hypothetical protein